MAKKNSDSLFFSPRWAKVFRDVLTYKGRSLLVVLTIAIGVAGVGVVGQASVMILSRAMSDSLASAQPSQITITTAPFRDEEILDKLRTLSQVSKAEALSYYRLRINVSDNGNGQPVAEMWKNFDLFAFPDYMNKQIDRIFPENNKVEWAPVEGKLLLERLAAQYLGVKVHDPVWIETPDSELHRFSVDGTLRNAGRESATISRVGSGFVSMDTVEAIGLPSGFNTIVIRVQGDGRDNKLLESVASKCRELLRDQSVVVNSTWISEPGKHWASDIVNSMGSILKSLGVLALIASAFLVVNTMLAILSSQLRQIGVMQVLGAAPSGLVRMYLTQALIFGLLALSIGIPIGVIGAAALTGQTNTLLNFKSDGYSLFFNVLALQFVIGIGLPLLSAFSQF
jgi:putative ABC transport system permease protein